MTNPKQPITMPRGLGTLLGLLISAIFAIQHLNQEWQVQKFRKDIEQDELFQSLQAYAPDSYARIESQVIQAIRRDRSPEAANSIILKEHEYVKTVPTVLSGSIKLRKVDETGREIVFYHIEAGESCILSITSCLNEKVSQAEAIVEQDTSVRPSISSIT